jgi:hypothetical protein
METFYVVLHADLRSVAGKRETETEAWELAEKLAGESGKSFIVAQVLGIQKVERYPTKRVYVGKDESD